MSDDKKKPPAEIKYVDTEYDERGGPPSADEVRQALQGVHGKLTPLCGIRAFDGTEKAEIVGNPETGEMVVKDRIVLEPGDVIVFGFRMEEPPGHLRQN